METTSSFYDPEDLSIREQFRRYGKRHGTSAVSPHQESSISKFSEPILFHDGTRIHSPTNTALILENIKQEVESIDFEGTPSKMQSAFKRRSSIDSRGLFEADVAVDSVGRLGSQSLKACKIEDESLIESGETTFVDFASLLDSALQGLISIPDLILRFERSCRDVSESIRYGNNIKLWFMEDKLMRQKAQLLLDEAATWSLLWYLYGKGMEDPPEETNLVRGSHVDTYLPNPGVWHHTQRLLNKGGSDAKIVHHLDFDAPTREHAHQLLDDKVLTRLFYKYY